MGYYSYSGDVVMVSRLQSEITKMQLEQEENIPVHTIFRTLLQPQQVRKSTPTKRVRKIVVTNFIEK